jgi:hypothetical protein
MKKRITILLGLAILAVPLHAQFGRRRGGDYESRVMPNVPYDGRFTFARIRYDRWYSDNHITNEGPGWMHDYPWAEQNLTAIVTELTSLRPYRDGGNIFRMDDPELMKYPWAYFSEPGWFEISESEADGLRNYLLKGGSVIFDDFGGPYHWENLERQMKRVLPDAVWMPIEGSHPVFDSFFGIVNPEERYPNIQFYGLFENNDPDKRLFAIANYNADLGENWQFAANGFYPVDMTNEAYKLGVNYIIYGLTR